MDPARVLVVLRPPPDVSLYHRQSNPLFPMTLDHLGRLENVHAFVLPRTGEQREYVRALHLPSVILPESAVDAQSLIALADVVVSAGGTMNREAAALGVPVYTTYGGRLGAGGGRSRMPSHTCGPAAICVAGGVEAAVDGRGGLVAGRRCATGAAGCSPSTGPSPVSASGVWSNGGRRAGRR